MPRNFCRSLHQRWPGDLILTTNPVRTGQGLNLVVRHEIGLLLVELWQLLWVLGGILCFDYRESETGQLGRRRARR